MREVGAETARMFQKGFAHRSLPELALLLGHSDQRVRQASQFAMVGKGAEAIGVFSELTKGEAKFEYASLHALWGLGQLYRQGVEGSADPIVDALSSKEPEVRANAARVVGDSMVVEGQSDLTEVIEGPFIPGGFSFGNRPWSGCSQRRR